VTDFTDEYCQQPLEVLLTDALNLARRFICCSFSADGKPENKQVLDFVAEPIEITGEVKRQGELLILRANPATYRRAL
jgi:hypothetical protein